MRYANSKISGEKPKGIDKFEDVVKGYLSPSKDRSSNSESQVLRESENSFGEDSIRRLSEISSTVKSNKTLSKKIDWRFGQAFLLPVCLFIKK